MKEATTLQAYRVRSCISLQGEEARSGAALLQPADSIDDALLLVQNNRVVFVGKYSPKELPSGLNVRDVHDLGEGVLVPAALNAHTHIQLSHLAGRTTWGQGFVPWLQSLIPQLALPFEEDTIRKTLETMRFAGTSYFADFTNMGMPMVATQAELVGIEGIFLAEWFGFADVWHSEKGNELAFLPARVRALWEEMPPALRENSIPCGHALYSTAPLSLQKAHAWCSRQKTSHKRPFVLHLAEFPEEVEALTLGTGALVDAFTPVVLAPDWKAPHCRPVAFAKKLGLLTENTLAVHCVHVQPDEITLLEQARASVCLCPRSNANIGVGTAPIRAFMDSSVTLCLGTDGLTSNDDVDVWREAFYLRDVHDVPFWAALRMLTVNAAKILGVDKHHTTKNTLGVISVGSYAHWHMLENIW